MSKTYHPRVYAYHKRTVNGMDNARAGRYSGDGVRNCWNLVARGKFEQRDGQRVVGQMPEAVTWGRTASHHSAYGFGGAAFVSPHSNTVPEVVVPDLWTPDSVGSIAAWWDASDDSTLTIDGNKVVGWACKLTGNTLSGTSAIAPEFAATSDVGQAVRFVRTSSHRLLSGAAVNLGEHPFVWAMVIDVQTLGSVGVFQHLVSGVDFQYIRLGEYSNTEISSTSVFGRSIALGANLILATFNGTSSSIYVNGATTTGNSGTTAWNTAVRVGARGLGSTDWYFNGHIAEIFAFNSTLSANDSAGLQIYVNRKYGI